MPISLGPFKYPVPGARPGEYLITGFDATLSVDDDSLTWATELIGSSPQRLIFTGSRACTAQDIIDLAAATVAGVTSGFSTDLTTPTVVYANPFYYTNANPITGPPFNSCDMIWTYASPTGSGGFVEGVVPAFSLWGPIIGGSIPSNYFTGQGVTNGEAGTYT